MTNNFFTIQEIEEKIREFAEFNNSKAAFMYLEKLEALLKNEKLKIDIKTKKEYEKFIYVLKFLSLNFLENWEEIKILIKEHYDLVAQMQTYDLWNKVKLKLLTEPSVEERDKIKNEIKNVLLNCNQIILNKEKYKMIDNLPLTVADWVRDYNVNLGTQKVENLKRVQYFTNDKKINKLDSVDKYKIKKLLDLYERLKYSSGDRHGFEEDVPMVVNGRLVIFSKGEAEIVSDEIKDLISSIDNPEKKIDLSKARQPLAPPKTEKESEIDNLQKMAENYELGTLERRAIEEEIRKLKLNIRYQNIKDDKK